MLSSRLSFVALIASLASLSACSAPYAESDDPERTGDDTQAIKGGSLATDYPEAVLLLMKVGGAPKSLCSGSLLAPNIVLTAGHCVHGFDSWTVTAPFANGQTAGSSNAVTYDWNSGGDTVDPNSHDVALVILDTPITLASYPTVATSELADGAKVVNVGRINNGQLSNTALYKSKPLAVKSAVSAGYPFDYMADEVIEHGDSGGPVFISGSHTVVAVNSGGGGGTEILARVDLLHDWIVQKVAANSGSGGGGQGGSDPGTGSGGGGSDPDGPSDPGGPGGNSCPGLPPFGYCHGNTLLVCQNSSVKAISCPSLGRFCGFDYAHGHYGCL